MRYLSVCSGIEAASVAFEPLEFEPVGFSEIADFQSAVLSHRYPDVINFGNMLDYDRWELQSNFEILIGGTPCQSFSAIGKGGGLDDDRGKLAIIYTRILAKHRPKWFIWENVPGVLANNSGRDFEEITQEISKLGYSFSYRILDARFFGLPQQRRRVFIIGHSSGDWRYPAAVLFDSKSMCRDTKAFEKEKQNNPRRPVSSIAGNIRTTTRFNSHCLNAGSMGRIDYETETFVSYISPEFKRVRKLTVLECERIQGFPDNWTLIPYGKSIPPIGTRYSAIGNSMAVPVIRFLGTRIQAVDKITNCT